MFKSWKNKDGAVEFVSTNPIVIPRNRCIKCEKPLKLGEFAYDQNTCWSCFEKQVYRIARNTETIEENKIVMHLLALAKEIHRI